LPIIVGVANRLEKLQRDFLRGGIGDEFKFHIVNWLRICNYDKVRQFGGKKSISVSLSSYGKMVIALRYREVGFVEFGSGN